MLFLLLTTLTTFTISQTNPNIEKNDVVKCENNGFFVDSARYEIKTKYSTTTDDCWKMCWENSECKYSEYSHIWDSCELFSDYHEFQKDIDYDVYSMKKDGTKCPEEKEIHPAAAMGFWMIVFLFCCLPCITLIIFGGLIYKCCYSKPVIINNAPPQQPVIVHSQQPQSQLQPQPVIVHSQPGTY
jgi:hypothetical protein